MKLNREISQLQNLLQQRVILFSAAAVAHSGHADSAIVIKGKVRIGGIDLNATLELADSEAKSILATLQAINATEL